MSDKDYEDLTEALIAGTLHVGEHGEALPGKPYGTRGYIDPETGAWRPRSLLRRRRRAVAETRPFRVRVEEHELLGFQRVEPGPPPRFQTRHPAALPPLEPPSYGRALWLEALDHQLAIDHLCYRHLEAILHPNYVAVMTGRRSGRSYLVRTLTELLQRWRKEPHPMEDPPGAD